MKRQIRWQDYFHQLQLEYLSYLTRQVIYDREKELKMVEDILRGKKDNIHRMALRNKVRSLFNSEDKYHKLFTEFVGDGYGIPNFQYRDEKEKMIRGYWDKRMFFNKGILIEYEGKEYQVVQNLIVTKECVIIMDGRMVKVPHSKCKRNLIKEIPFRYESGPQIHR